MQQPHLEKVSIPEYKKPVSEERFCKDCGASGKDAALHNIYHCKKGNAARTSYVKNNNKENNPKKLSKMYIP